MRGVWLLVLLIGCTPIRPLGQDPDGGRTDAGAMDAGGRVDAGEEPDAGGGSDAGCMTGTSRCEGTQLVECEAGAERITDCDLTCGGSPAMCLRFVPSNVAGDIALDAGGAELVVTDDLVFNTDTGEIEVAMGFGGGAVIRAAGEGEIADIEFLSIPTPDGQPTLGVFAMRSLEIGAGQSVVATGDAALVIIAEERVGIDGELSVDARVDTGFFFMRDGAGATNGGGTAAGTGQGLGGGRGGMFGNGGGGGGSFGSVGGTGGGLGGGLPGGAYGSDDLVPLVSGSGGGGGDGVRGGGGDGGGVVQISAGVAIEVGPKGRISACGEGGSGAGGDDTTPGNGGGGGGGSGGAILLEAPDVAIMGLVGANGGAGAQGSVANNALSAGGQDGSVGNVPAGGSPTMGSGGGGGDGSGIDGVAGDGQDAPRGGGGGGGAGRIRINTLTGTEMYDVSPGVGRGSSVGTINTAP